MFSRVTYEAWTTIVPMLAFVLTTGAFAAIVVRALRMGSTERRRMAHLPLDEQADALDEATEPEPEAPRGFLGRLVVNPFAWMVLATMVVSAIFAFAH